MTTPIAHHSDSTPPREKIPAVEQDTAEPGAATPLPNQQLASSQFMSTSPAPVQGNWFHRNRWFTKEPITNLGYQFVRSSLATIPYGFAMAAGHHLFNMFSVWGQKAGLTPDGIETFTNAVSQKASGVAEVEKAAAAVEKAAAEGRRLKEIYRPGIGAAFGRGLMRLGNSPMNAAVQIALGFTLFRFVGGLVKNLRDRVMNENNTPAETNAETKHWWETIKQTARINWKAESVATPIAALILGFMNATFSPSPQSIAKREEAEKKLYPGIKGFWKQTKKLWFDPKAKLLQNAGVWTFSYSLFFLMAEELFKDMQLRRGLWKGHPNSLKNGPDDTVGGPGAIVYKTPEKDLVVQPISMSAEEGYRPEPEPAAKDSKHPLCYPFFSGEPSMGRFIFRRVLPVCVGISAYAALKRVGYLAAGGVMKPITVPVANELKGFGGHAKFYLENARREGIATAMFGALWAATDAWGGWYDDFFHKLQKQENAVPLNEHQQQKHWELLTRLNAKEQQQAIKPVAQVSNVQHDQRVANDPRYTQVANA